METASAQLSRRPPARDCSCLSNADLLLLSGPGRQVASKAKDVLRRLYPGRQDLAAVLEALPDPTATGFEGRQNENQ